MGRLDEHRHHWQLHSGQKVHHVDAHEAVKRGDLNRLEAILQGDQSEEAQATVVDACLDNY